MGLTLTNERTNVRTTKTQSKILRFVSLRGCGKAPDGGVGRMKFSVEIPDEIFWLISRRAEKLDLTVPHFVAQVSARLASIERPKPGDAMAELQREIKAARANGWRPPSGSLKTKRTKHVDFTDRQMEAALAAMEGTHNT